MLLHCNKNPIYVFPERNPKASVPISAFICLRAIDILSESVHIFSCSRIDRPTLGIHNSLTDECGNCDWSRAVPFMGIFVSNFRYCVCAVYIYLRNQRLSNVKNSFSWYSPYNNFGRLLLSFKTYSQAVWRTWSLWSFWKTLTVTSSGAKQQLPPARDPLFTYCTTATERPVIIDSIRIMVRRPLCKAWLVPLCLCASGGGS